VQLESVQRRLELLLAAMYGRQFQIAAVPEPRRRSWWLRPFEAGARLLDAEPRHLRTREVLAATEGECIQLPHELPTVAGNATTTLAQYRLLAIEQAERLTRGTAAYAPGADRLEHDLYLLRESAAIDAAIARANAGLAPALHAARAAALARRPSLDALTSTEREVELLLRRALAGELTETPGGATAGSTPADSLAWARETAARLRAAHGTRGTRGAYRGLQPVSLWGSLRSATTGAPARDDGAPNFNLAHHMPPSVMSMPTRSTLPGAEGAEDEDDDTPPEHASDAAHGARPHPNQPPEDLEAHDADGMPDHSAAPLEPQSREHADAPGAPPEGVRGERVAVGVSETVDTTHLPEGTPYDEWDAGAGRYRPRSVMVRSYEAAQTDDRWAAGVLTQRAALVRRVRQQFERLRARRSRLDQQREGDELDIAACVGAIVDRRTGHSPDDRLYTAIRPARRGLAIALLVDVSGSTDTPVSDSLQIIDIEKIALLLASEALDALGDLYAVLTFSGKSAEDVRVTTIKDFSERNGELVRRRVSALAPAGFTRLGAAVRHASALLARQTAGHRLLLILSDGRPNDMDHYQDTYGVEDARQAIMEARASGVYPFCLTVDREGAEYLPRIFGTAGHTILRDPEQLPLALLGMVRRLLARG
jgi:nitric oxide reductase NorD protein